MKHKIINFFMLPVFSFFVAFYLTGCSTSVDSSTEIKVTQILIEGESSVVVNEEIQLTAYVYPLTIKNPSIKWRSMDSAIATVDEAGKVTGVKPGIVTIFASYGGMSGRKEIQVKSTAITPDFENGATDGVSVGTSGKLFEAGNTSDASAYTVLVWSDEFEGTSLKTENWVYEEGMGNWGWGNNEQQYYTKGQNLTVGDGVMDIIAKEDFTSTRIKSADKKHFKYGRIESRMKIDQGVGSWPAFWMLGNHKNRTWPQCGEIDIMEHANEVDYVNHTLHWNNKGSDYDGGYSDANHGMYGTTNPRGFDITEWHTYSCEWTENKIVMYVDDVETFSKDIGNSAAGTDSFTKDSFYFLYNFAMGGLYVENVDKSTFTNMPWHMLVDYVRVYQDANATVDGTKVEPQVIQVSSISLNKTTATLDIGGTETLTATVNPSNATDKTVTWTSDKPAVAKVENGKVTALAKGTATITAAAGGKSASCTVTVNEPAPSTVAVTGVTLSSSTLTLTVGQESTLTATVAPANATDRTVTWTSNKPAVAKVENGKVTALAKGTATITAAAGGKSATCTVTVNEAASAPESVPQTITLNSKTYNYVWSDEFNYTGLPSSSKWGYDVGDGVQNNSDGTNPGNAGWGNKELQWYSNADSDNTYVSDGSLKINAIRESSNGKEWTSGRIVTRNIPKAQFKYGYIEMKAKIPKDAGVWPAFWMLDNDIYGSEGVAAQAWPRSGEIDIMETSINKWGNKVYGTLHCQAGYSGNPVITKAFDQSYTGKEFTDGQYHTYAVDWDDDHIDWYYDGVKQFTYTPSSYEKEPWPFNEEFYIIINLAVGGGLGGTVPATLNKSTMEIDYVRVYQKSNYTDRIEVVTDDAPPSALASKTIPSGAKVLYDASTGVNTFTGTATWNGGIKFSDYTVAGKNVKQVYFNSISGDNSCGCFNLNTSYEANAKLHMSVYAKNNFKVKPVSPNTEFAQTVSNSSGEWVDVEIDLGAAASLTQLGLISTVKQFIYVDKVYITDGSADSGSTGGETGGNTGGETGGETGGNEGGETGGTSGGEKPAAPFGFVVNNVGVDSISAAWGYSGTCDSFALYLGNKKAGTITNGGSVSVDYAALGFTEGQKVSVTVVAVKDGVESDKSPAVEITVPSADAAPDAPAGLVVQNSSANHVGCAWAGVAGIDSYNLYIDGVKVGTITNGGRCENLNLTSGSHTAQITAVKNGKESEKSGVATFTVN